ncbi:MAG: hypothetical protein DRP09_13250, partial [Candidatus Thorarchaeota archaeon]
PGILFWDNIQEGNTTPWLGELQGTNPCITGDTEIAVADGRDAVTIEQLTNEGKDVPVYCFDGNRIRISMGRNPRKTRKNVDIFKITLDDGTSFKATADHSIMLRNGEYRRVDQLKKDDSIMPFNNNNESNSSCRNMVNFEHVGKSDVYNLSVDYFHNFAIITNHITTRGGKDKLSGIIIKNCSETGLYNGESCILGSVNLYNHLKNENDKVEVDYDKLRETTRTLVHMLNACLDKNKYPFEFMREAALKTRKIGIGIMGFADLLGRMGVKYGSEESMDLAHKIMGYINSIASRESERMAEEHGPFPGWIGGTGVKGRRNATVTSIAPTGSTSFIAGVSSGLEPFFKIAYMMNRDNNESNIVVARSFMDKIKEDKLEDVIEVMINEDLTPNQMIKRGLLPKTYSHFVTANEVTPEDHVKMQATFQKHVEMSISKTINMPHDATVEDVKKIIRLAYKLGTKGITIFRDDCFRDAFLTEITCSACGSTNLEHKEGCITCNDCGVSLCSVG